MYVADDAFSLFVFKIKHLKSWLFKFCCQVESATQRIIMSHWGVPWKWSVQPYIERASKSESSDYEKLF